MRRRKAAIVIGSDGNIAAASRIAASMMAARARTPGTSALRTPRDGFGLLGLLMIMLIPRLGFFIYSVALFSKAVATSVEAVTTSVEAVATSYEAVATSGEA